MCYSFEWHQIASYVHVCNPIRRQNKVSPTIFTYFVVVVVRNFYYSLAKCNNTIVHKQYLFYYFIRTLYQKKTNIKCQVSGRIEYKLHWIYINLSFDIYQYLLFPFYFILQVSKFDGNMVTTIYFIIIIIAICCWWWSLSVNARVRTQYRVHTRMMIIKINVYHRVAMGQEFIVWTLNSRHNRIYLCQHIYIAINMYLRAYGIALNDVCIMYLPM